MKKSVQFALIAGAGTFAAADVQAAISYTNPGPHTVPGGDPSQPSTYQHRYKQNFDSLPKSPVEATMGSTPSGWVDDSTSPGNGQFSIPGWYLYHPLAATEGGANGHQRLRVGDGSANTGTFWSYGSEVTTGEFPPYEDRALGSLNGDTMSTASDATVPPTTLEAQQMFIGVRITNNSGVTLNSFTAQYDAEQWRKSGNGPETWDFEYSLDQTATIDAPHSQFTSVDAGDFTSPVNTTGAGAVDGNTAGKVVVAPFTVTGLSWAPGTDLWLRWSDTNLPGSTSALRADQGMAIDNFAFSAEAVPEPTGLALLALGAAGLLARRREG